MKAQKTQHKWTYEKDPYWIVEHETYGVLMEWEWRYYQKGGSRHYPKFSWTAYRSEGIHYQTEEEAKQALELVRKSGRPGASKCYVYEMRPGSEHVRK